MLRRYGPGPASPASDAPDAGTEQLKGSGAADAHAVSPVATTVPLADVEPGRWESTDDGERLMAKFRQKMVALKSGPGRMAQAVKQAMLDDGPDEPSLAAAPLIGGGVVAKVELTEVRPPVSDGVRQTRLAVFHQMLRLCGETRIITPAEAEGLIQSRTPDTEGMIMGQLATFINMAADAVQNALLSRTRVPALPFVVFNKTAQHAQLGDFQDLLKRHGIMPLLSQDTVISCLMSFPGEAELVLALSREQGRGFRWCHGVICRANELNAHVTQR